MQELRFSLQSEVLLLMAILDASLSLFNPPPPPDLNAVARNLILERKSLLIREGKLWRFIHFIVITNFCNLL